MVTTPSDRTFFPSLRLPRRSYITFPTVRPKNILFCASSPVNKITVRRGGREDKVTMNQARPVLFLSYQLSTWTLTLAFSYF